MSVIDEEKATEIPIDDQIQEKRLDQANTPVINTRNFQPQLGFEFNSQQSQIRVFPDPPLEIYIVLQSMQNRIHTISHGTPELPRCFYRQKLGRLYVLTYKKNKLGEKEPSCVLGPCWPMVLLVSFLLLGVPTLVLVLMATTKDVKFLYLTPIFVVISGITFFFYARTACTDPGAQKIEKTQLGADWFYDDRIQSYRAPSWRYDQETELLIEDIDHFCPWTGTTIAKKNMKMFLSFNGCLWILCAVTIGLPLLYLLFV